MNPGNIFPSVSSIVNERLAAGEGANEFGSFDAALVAAGGEGYAQSLIAEVVLQKTNIYRERLVSSEHPILTANQARQILALTLSKKSDELSVLDLGGACGVHYFLAKKIFGNEFKFRWSIVESREMVDKGRILESDELRFFTTIETAIENDRAFDLAFSSGALQYVPNAFEMMRTLMDVRADNLFLTRVALSLDDRDHIYIHESRLNKHGRGGPLESAPDVLTKCPVVMICKAKLEKVIASQYEIAMEFSESAAAYKYGRHSYNQYGYYCRIRK